jgi:uncharacterized protein (DUF779 family)
MEVQLSTTIQTCPITATSMAKEALTRLRRRHGEIILHVTGGCCDARTPLCLPANELRLGARDILLGMVEGVAVYEMQSTPELCYCNGAYLLDMAPGVPVGFSLDPGEGMRFTIREDIAGHRQDVCSGTGSIAQSGVCAS